MSNRYLAMERDLGPALTANIMLQDARHLLVSDAPLHELAEQLSEMLVHTEHIEPLPDEGSAQAVQLLVDALCARVAARPQPVTF